MDSQEGAQRHRAEVDDALRAIGRYFVRFSQLVARMRFAMSARLTTGTTDSMELGEIAFATATAQQVADSFFTMCRYDGNFDGNETAIANALRKAVDGAIKDRNYFAHGDWWIDQFYHEHPELVRMTPQRRQGDFADLTPYPPKDLEEKCAGLLRMLEDVAEFGALALGLEIIARPEGRPGVRHAEPREFRVRDVFTLQAGKGGVRGTPAKVMRNGPRAHEVVRMVPTIP